MTDVLIAKVSRCALREETAKSRQTKNTTEPHFTGTCFNSVVDTNSDGALTPVVSVWEEKIQRLNCDCHNKTFCWRPCKQLTERLWNASRIMTRRIRVVGSNCERHCSAVLPYLMARPERSTAL